MAQVYKITTGKDMVNSEVWFQKVDGAERLTRSAADPLNLRAQAARLEVRRNKIPSEVKNARTVAIFKDGYAKHRVGLVESTDYGKGEYKMEECRPHPLLTLAEKPYLGHCESTSQQQ